MKRFLRHALIGFTLTSVQTSVWADAAPQAVAEMAKQQVPKYLETLQSLVSVESGSRDLEGLVKVRGLIEAKLKALEIPFEIIAAPGDSKAGSMVRATLKGKGTKHIALIAHMDTVYQRGDLAKQPFRIEGDKAFGLGIADDKGGVAMVLHTLEIVKTLKIDGFGQLTVFFNGDEEIGSFVSRDYFTALGRENDVGLSFEGSGTKADYVRLATSSIARVFMKVKGRASHSGANPDFGRNALYELSHQLLQAEADRVRRQQQGAPPGQLGGRPRPRGHVRLPRRLGRRRRTPPRRSGEPVRQPQVALARARRQTAVAAAGGARGGGPRLHQRDAGGGLAAQQGERGVEADDAAADDDDVGGRERAHGGGKRK
jgi:acetylornithine deacetylase/succinyl-diaminopimelate desuccinylase-like protein